MPEYKIYAVVTKLKLSMNLKSNELACVEKISNAKYMNKINFQGLNFPNAWFYLNAEKTGNFSEQEQQKIYKLSRVRSGCSQIYPLARLATSI